MTKTMRIAAALLLWWLVARPGLAQETIPTFDELLAYKVALRPELVGVHPRVFVTKAGLEVLRERARTTHRAEWAKVTAHLAAMKGAPPPVPGPQERRSQNDAAFAIAELSLAYAVEKKPEQLTAAKAWTLAAIDYEPWGYTYNKPNTDLAAGHLLYALGWAYDLLYDDLTAAERVRIRQSLERHANLVYEAFAPKPGRKLSFTQNHDFIPTAGLAVTALALMGESKDAERWAVLARAHHHRAGQLLSPDGYYYESFEYWIFSSPWLVHFLDGWEHATGESLWDRDVFRNWKTYLAHTLLPDGQSVFDFGDIWEGALTRGKAGAEYARVYPGGTLQSNYNVMYRVAARFKDPQAQAVAERYASFGHSNLEEFWTLLWRDPTLAPAPMNTLPLAHHFQDSGVVYMRSSWGKRATALAFKAGPPEGHRVTALLPTLPEWRLDSGHAHPDAGTFIVWAHGRYLTGDTGYAGLPSSRNHNTLTFGGAGQGVETQHDVWREMAYRGLDAVRIREVDLSGGRARIVADLAAAYPTTAGVKTFTRSFTWDGGALFAVADAVALGAPKTAEWHLQSDTPFEGGGMRFQNGKAGEPRLRVSFASPTSVAVTTGRAVVKAPGPPGSIEKGSEEPRGHVLRAVAPAAETFRFDVTLEAVAPGIGRDAGRAESMVIPLWPEGVPGLKSDAAQERIVDGRVVGVHYPSLTLHAPETGMANGTAVIYCPGGGYVRLSIGDNGGADTKWLNGLGVTVFVLKYRMVEYGHPAPLRDVLRAIRIVRSRAAEFGVRPDRIGLLGSSAGGHLAASASVLWDAPEGRTGAAIDSVNARPDFAMLIYPVVTMGDPFVHKGSRTALLGKAPAPDLIDALSIEKHVRKDTPPMFLVATTADQSVPVENSLHLYKALHDAGVPAEMHVYAQGAHGASRDPQYGTTALWPHRAEEWMRANGMIK